MSWWRRSAGVVAVLGLAACAPHAAGVAQPPLAAAHAAPSALSCVTDAHGVDCAPARPPAATVTSSGAIAVTFTDAAHGWAVGYRCALTCAIELAATADGGSTWSPPRVIGTSTRPPANVVREGNDGWIFGEGGIWQTHDGGVTWRQTSDAQIVALAPADGTVLALEGCAAPASACRQQLLMSQRSSDDWRTAMPQPPFAQPVTVDPSAPGYALDRVSPAVAFVAAPAASGQGLYVTRDGGTSWHALVAPCVEIAGLQSSDGVHVVVLCSTPCCTGNWVKAVFASVDGGASWVKRAATVPAQIGSIPFYGPGYALTMTSRTMGLFGSSGIAGIWRTTDDGASWQPVYTDTCSGGGDAVREISFVDALRGWAVQDNNGNPQCPAIMRTSDGGGTWRAVSSPFTATT